MTFDFKSTGTLSNDLSIATTPWSITGSASVSGSGLDHNVIVTTTFVIPSILTESQDITVNFNPSDWPTGRIIESIVNFNGDVTLNPPSKVAITLSKPTAKSITLTPPSSNPL